MIIENILKFAINHATDSAWGNILPLQSSDELLSFSPFKMAQGMLMPSDSLSTTTYLIAAIAWCLIYYITARRTLLKSDW
jgi:hypothetical protein